MCGLRKSHVDLNCKIFPQLAKEIRAGRKKEAYVTKQFTKNLELSFYPFQDFGKDLEKNIQQFRTLQTVGILTLHVPSLIKILRFETLNVNGNKRHVEHSSTAWSFKI